MSRRAFFALVIGVVVVLVGAAVFWPKQSNSVTVYCATDDAHAIPIITAFKDKTGIDVNFVPDTEASKTVGLVRRLLEERASPRCDVFWNNEILHTVRLANDGMLEPYRSPAAADIPDAFKDPQGRWTGFAARARVLIVNTQLLPDEAARPTSMNDLVAPAWKDRAAFVRPFTGTTLTHATTLYSTVGEENARAWFRGLHANDVMFPSSNSQVAISVSLGHRHFGFTDTDDVRKVVLQGKPVTQVYPDQGEGQPGTLLILNTVALIKGGPRPDLGRRFIDFLLSKDVEERLAHGDSAQIPLRGDVKRPDHVKGPPQFRAMAVDWNEVAVSATERLKELEALWGE